MINILFHNHTHSTLYLSSYITLNITKDELKFKFVESRCLNVGSQSYLTDFKEFILLYTLKVTFATKR